VNCKECRIRKFYNRYPKLLNSEGNGNHPPCQTPDINPRLPLLRNLAKHIQERHNDGKEGHYVADLVDFFRALVGKQGTYTTLRSLKLYENEDQLLLLARGQQEGKAVEFLACFRNLEEAQPTGTLYTLERGNGTQKLLRQQNLAPLGQLETDLTLLKIRVGIDFDLQAQQDRIERQAPRCPVLARALIESYTESEP
jgi:hypothetical protein